MERDEKINELLNKCERGELSPSAVIADLVEANWNRGDEDFGDFDVALDIGDLLSKGCLDFAAVKDFVKKALRAYVEKNLGNGKGMEVLDWYAGEIASADAVAEVAEKKYGIGVVNTEWRGNAPRTNVSRRA